MPAIQSPPMSEAANRDAVATLKATRFDPPHEIPRVDTTTAARHDAPPPSEALSDLPVDAPTTADALATAENIAPALVRQFRTQAQQLTSHLEARQRELDHREAELHTQLARHEAAARSARLWFQEQHRKLTQRQTEWESREQEIAGRLRSFSGPAALLADGSAADGPPREKTAAIDQEIDFRLREADFHELSAQLEASHHHSEALAKRLDVRQQHIETAESRLARSEAELQFARQEFHAEREAHAARMQCQRRQSIEERARLDVDLARQRAELDERANQLEKRSAAIEQLRGELLQIQRDTLESQLAAEELRAELAGKAPPAAIVQSLARLRAKLTDQYRLQSDDLERGRQQLSETAANVAVQHRQLAARQRELESWTAGQQRQIESQAAQLVEREQLLERRHGEYDSRRLQWETERRELEIEARRLQTHIRRLEDNVLEQN